MHLLSLTTVAILLAHALSSSPAHVDARDEKPPRRIVFVSCHSLKPPLDAAPSPLWDLITNRKPEVFIWGGDNMYADKMEFSLYKILVEGTLPFVAGNESDITREYRKLHQLKPYQTLLKSGADVLAVYDDHDFGINDGDKTYPLRRQSKELFLREMLRVSEDDVRFKQPGGVYFAKTYAADTPESFRVVLLDVRYDRDPWSVGKTGDMLGEAQWKWLESELCSERTARIRVNLIVSPLQVLFEHRAFGESWSLFPGAKQRLLDMVHRCGVKGVLFLSGDVHMAEFLEAKCDVIKSDNKDDNEGRRTSSSFSPSTLAEVTSSGLTHSWGTRPPQSNSTLLSRVLRWAVQIGHWTLPWNYRSTRAVGPVVDRSRGAYYLGLNFAEIRLDFSREVVEVDIVGVEDRAVMSQTYSFAELTPPRISPEEHVVCRPYRGRDEVPRLYATLALLLAIPLSLIVYLVYVMRRIVRVVWNVMFD